MALLADRNPIVFDAQGQEVAGKTKLAYLRLVAGSASSTCEILDRQGGNSLAKFSPVNAAQADEIAVQAWVDGLYVDSLTAGAKVYAYYE